MRNVWPQTLAAILTGLWLGSASATAPAPQGLNACINSCNASDLKPDDKATCKLECRYQHESSPSTTPSPTPTPSAAPAPSAPPTRAAPTPAPAPSGFDLTGCEAGCTVHMLDTDRATCRLQCRNQAETYRAAAAPSPIAPGQPAPGVAPASAPAGYTPTGVTGPGGAMTYSPTSSIAAAPQGPSPAAQQQLQACLADCNRASHRTSTDRETCKLNCNNLVETWAPATVYHPGGTSAASTREAIINSSAGVAGTAYPTPQAYWSGGASPPIAETPPAPSPPPASPALTVAPQGAGACVAAAQQCTQSCTSEVSACYRECSNTKGPATDKETCRLLCDSNREVCGQTCQAKSAACNRAAAPSPTR